MHLLLENLSIFTLHDLTESEEWTISLLQELDLIPSRDHEPPECPKCHAPMVTITDNNTKLGFRWACKRRTVPDSPCVTRMSPLKNTFFDNAKIPFRDTIGLIIGFVMDIKTEEIRRQISSWRFRRGEEKTHLNIRVVLDYYNKLIKICETIVSHNSDLRKGMGSKKPAVDCYRSKRLKVLSTFGQRVYAMLMDIKSEYPCIGKKLSQEQFILPSTNRNSDIILSSNEKTDILSDGSLQAKLSSVSTKSEDVALETSGAVKSPSIASMTADASVIHEKVDYVNAVAGNSDKPSSSDVNTLSEDVDLPLNPEVIFYVEDENLSQSKNRDMSSANFKDENMSPVNIDKAQQSTDRFNHLQNIYQKYKSSTKSIYQEKSDTVNDSDNLHPDDKRPIIFYKKMPLQTSKTKGHVSAYSKEKDRTISPTVAKDFSSNEKEEYIVPFVNSETVQLFENLQTTKSSDQSLANSIEKETCGVPSINSKAVQLSENTLGTESSNQPSAVSKQTGRNIICAIEQTSFSSNEQDKCIPSMVYIKTVQSPENITSANSNHSVFPVIEKTISTGKTEKYFITTVSTNKNEKYFITSSSSEKLNEKYIITSSSSKKLNEKYIITSSSSENMQHTKSSDQSSRNSTENNSTSSSVEKNISACKKKKLILPSTSSKKVKLLENT